MNKARSLLLAVAILSLIYGLWAAWAHFQGDITRDALLTRMGIATAVWFVSATAWAYWRERA